MKGLWEEAAKQMDPRYLRTLVSFHRACCWTTHGVDAAQKAAAEGMLRNVHMLAASFSVEGIRSVVCTALRSGQEPVVEWLLKKFCLKADDTNLLDAALQGGSLACVRMIVEKGASFCEPSVLVACLPNVERLQFLHSRDDRFCKLLISHPLVPGRFFTALDYALGLIRYEETGNVQSAEFLLRRGIKLSQECIVNPRWDMARSIIRRFCVEQTFSCLSLHVGDFLPEDCLRTISHFAASEDDVLLLFESHKIDISISMELLCPLFPRETTCSILACTSAFSTPLPLRM